MQYSSWCIFNHIVQVTLHTHFLRYTTHTFLLATFTFQKIIWYCKCEYCDYFLYTNCNFILTLPKTA